MPGRTLSGAFSSAAPLSLSSLPAPLSSKASCGVARSCTINKSTSLARVEDNPKKRSFGKSKRLRTNWQIQKIVRALATPFHEDALAALVAALGGSGFYLAASVLEKGSANGTHRDSTPVGFSDDDMGLQNSMVRCVHGDLRHHLFCYLLLVHRQLAEGYVHRAVDVHPGLDDHGVVHSR